MKKRPVGVTILAAISLLSALFKLLGLGILFSDDEMIIDAPMIGVSICFIFLRVVIAVGFLKGWSWTHILASIGFCIAGYQRLTAVGKSENPQIMFLASVVSLGIATYLLASSKVRKHFYFKCEKEE